MYVLYSCTWRMLQEVVLTSGVVDTLTIDVTQEASLSLPPSFCDDVFGACDIETLDGSALCVPVHSHSSPRRQCDMCRYTLAVSIERPSCSQRL